jgi:hypothetical protein
MRRKAPGRHCRQAKKIRNRLWRYENMNLDMAAKSRFKDWIPAFAGMTPAVSI